MSAVLGVLSLVYRQLIGGQSVVSRLLGQVQKNIIFFGAGLSTKKNPAPACGGWGGVGAGGVPAAGVMLKNPLCSLPALPLVLPLVCHTMPVLLPCTSLIAPLSVSLTSR